MRGPGECVGRGDRGTRLRDGGQRGGVGRGGMFVLDGKCFDSLQYEACGCGEAEIGSGRHWLWVPLGMICRLF